MKAAGGKFTRKQQVKVQIFDLGGGERMKMRKIKRKLSHAALLLLLSTLLPNWECYAEALAVPEENILENPLVFQNEDLPTGRETLWDCVYFGSYPSAEVVKSDWDAVDAYAVLDGDTIRNDRLYEALEKAEWTDDQLTLDGQDYVRINGSDAVTVSQDREQHYRWKDPEEWHYFLKEPVRWRILTLQEDEALLLADRLVDCRLFNEEDSAVTWETSTLRSWLNGYGEEKNTAGRDFSGDSFFDEVFDEAEKEAILPTHCITPDNLDYGTDSGPDTEDYVFLLSNEEVYADPVAGAYGFYAGRGFDDSSKRFTSTMYAKCRGAWWSPVDAYKGNSFWFMRTSGYTPYNVTYICDFGFVYSRGTTVTCDDAGILPAVRVDLTKADLVPAGEKSSAEIIKKMDDKPKSDLPVIKNPVITEDDSLPGGKSVVWDAVIFGSYPQTEILEGGETGTGTEADPELWKKLENAEWENDVTVIDDISYKRLNDRYFRFEPIRWRVLNVEGSTALLLADEGLDCFTYHPDLTDVNWDKSALRSWLNGLDAGENLAGLDYAASGDSFWAAAFSEEESASILTESVENGDNYYFGTACGEDTQDPVFLLSEREAFCGPKAEAYGFQPSDAVADPAKRFQPTAYAAARGAWRSQLPESEGNGFWFFRSNGYTASNVVYAGELGYIYNRGIPVTCRDACIIPAIRVDLGTAPLVPDGEIRSAEKIQ